MSEHMVRKQIYLPGRQNMALRRMAKERGVSEAEIVRQALEREAEAKGTQVRIGSDAWTVILAFVQARRNMPVSGGKPVHWERQEVYENRENRWTKPDSGSLDSLSQAGTACLSAQSLGEFASVALRKLDPPLTPIQVYEQVSLLMNAWPVLNLTPQIVLQACRGVRDHQLAFYDAQIWASARLNQIPVVLSEDFQDGQALEGMRCVNPFGEGFFDGEY